MSTIDEQLKNLEDAIQDVERNFQSQMPREDSPAPKSAENSKSFQVMYLIPLAVPIVVAGILYFWKPKIVKTKKSKLNKAAWLKWIVIITVVIWALLFLINYCAGGKIQGLLKK